jgi:membrane protein
MPQGEGEIAKAKREAANYIYKFIQNTSSGRLGALGVLLLIWTTIATLTRVEETFNDIWGVARGRDWWARITNYFTTVVLIPPLIFVALGLASGPHLRGTRALLEDVPWLAWLISQLLPILVISIMFALFYKLLPNTKVHFRAAIVGATLAAVCWYGFNLFSLYLAGRWVSASKVYGSLALIPLLMASLWVVWVIVLFGAQVAYAFQNRESYLQERLAENVNQRGREFVALRLMTCIGQHFQRGLPPATVPQMSRELGIPSKLVQQVLCTLLAARLVAEVAGPEPGYTPARPLETINCHHILLAMRATQGQELVTREEPVREEVYGEFARIQSAEKEAASTVTMLALVNRAHARLELTASLPVSTRESKGAAAIEMTELPQEPATATAPESEEKPAEPALTPKPMSVAAAAPITPRAESPANDDQSFPL